MRMPNFRSAGFARGAAAVLGLAVVLLVVLLACNVGDGRRGLEGFWSGEPDFAADAGLAEVYLYIDAGRRGVSPRNSYPSYLVMTNDDGVICNQKITVTATTGYGLRRKAAYSYAGQISFEDPEELPDELTPSVYGERGEALTGLTFELTAGNSRLTILKDSLVLLSCVRDAGPEDDGAEAFSDTLY